MKKYLIVSYVVLLSVSATADIKYNPYSNDWERSPSDGILKYNLMTMIGHMRDQTPQSIIHIIILGVI